MSLKSCQLWELVRQKAVLKYNHPRAVPMVSNEEGLGSCICPNRRGGLGQATWRTLRDVSGGEGHVDWCAILDQCVSQRSA